MKKLLAAILLLSASPATAQTLWQNVEAGMTEDQVRELYPDARFKRDNIEIRNFRPLPKCPSTVNVRMKDNVVGMVEVRGAASITGGCSEDIRGALIARYGEPHEREIDPNYILGASYPITSYFWIKDGVVMRFQKFEGMGLSHASWVMEYVSATQLEEHNRRRGDSLGL